MVSFQVAMSRLQIILPEQEIEEEPSIDFAMIFGHVAAKRVHEIAAAGGHHILMTGPPGCGKSMLAEAFQTC